MAQRYRFAGRGGRAGPAHGSKIGAHGSSSVALVFAVDAGAGEGGMPSRNNLGPPGR
jgi:hypothetical protein